MGKWAVKNMQCFGNRDLDCGIQTQTTQCFDTGKRKLRTRESLERNTLFSKLSGTNMQNNVCSNCKIQ